jgi:hypothetical protein
MNSLTLKSTILLFALTAPAMAQEPRLLPRLDPLPGRTALVLQTQGTPGSLYHVFVGLPAKPTPILYGTLFLSPTMIIPIRSGVIGHQGASALVLRLPGMSQSTSRIGLGFQALVAEPNGAVKLTNGTQFSAWTEDQDGDRVGDTRFVDLNGDAKIDIIYIDKNENTLPEEVWKDTNGDGVVDEVWYDKNEDGRFEEAKFDTNRDGKFDRRWVDENFNGLPEASEVFTIKSEAYTRPGPMKKAPCPGAQLVLDQAAYECYGPASDRRWSLVYTTVWKCPNGNEIIEKREVLRVRNGC